MHTDSEAACSGAAFPAPAPGGQGPPPSFEGHEGGREDEPGGLTRPGGGATRQGTGASIEVLREDQERINRFGQLNNKRHELADVLKAQKKLLEDLEDASNELMLADEDVCKYSIGGVFVHMDSSSADDKLTEKSDEVAEEVRGLEGELGSIEGEMGDLKKLLYGKFGTAINLEEDA